MYFLTENALKAYYHCKSYIVAYWLFFGVAFIVFKKDEQTIIGGLVYELVNQTFNVTYPFAIGITIFCILILLGMIKSR